MNRSQSRSYYFSELLKQYFGKGKSRIDYPSLLLFIVERIFLGVPPDPIAHVHEIAQEIAQEIAID